MPLKQITHRFTVMGGPAELQLYLDATTQDKNQLVQLAENEAYRLEKKYSRYRDDSVTSRINHSAGQPEAMEVDDETAALLNYAQIAWQQSNGLFDITSGTLRRAWDFKSNHLPDKNQIAELLNNIGWQKLLWQAPLLQLPFGMEIDFGGVVKEYAADAIATLLRNQDVQHGLVELAGDISIIGAHPNGKAWKIGVRDPQNPETAIATIDAFEGAVASSGNYERFMIVDGQRYGHILNPKTGWPENSVASVSVHASTCLVAGTATTTAMLLGATQGRKWLQDGQFQHLLFEV
ncbi:FAD:protein FMN transferase [hydrothermal vent metagenome]|uniref:FAD:protein FMN transferase n=1 Tax=hydrothermal vent metagenome TaxID=652676 RepID=A0A3B1A7D5_9ZZZZ